MRALYSWDMSSLIDQLKVLESAIRQHRTDEAILALTRARNTARRDTRRQQSLETDIGRYQLMMARTLEVTLTRGLQPVAQHLLDGMIAVVQARRAFLGLYEGESWRFLAARDHEGCDIDDPTAQTSSTIIAATARSPEAQVAHNAAAQTAFAAQPSVHALKLRSVACLPLQLDGRIIGFIYLDDPKTRRLFDEAALDAVKAWLPLVAGCVSRALEQEQHAILPGVISRSPVMHAALSELARIARFDVSVLLTGETGTGKSLIARRLHAASPRAAGPFVHINCGAIPEALLESELFGHKKGAFTGASADRIGKFEAANGGTLFLDELGSMPLTCQVKLLVALQERAITRLGDSGTVPVDVRVVAAMNTDPSVAIASGTLREDLYYRLAVFVARLPPLRERMEDIPLLARHILENTCARYNLPPLRLSDAALDDLLSHPWPGNVRELENALDRAAVLSRDGTIERIFRQGAHAVSAAAPAPRDLVGALEAAAQQLVGELQARDELQDKQTLEVFRGLVLLQAISATGSREDAFRLLGMANLLANRNHHRRLKKELAVVQTFYRRVGAEPPVEPA